jgi:GT2 family glycosyltransferase
MTELDCSVVIPSYNREEALSKVLVGLANQTVPLDSFEVIVILDGSTDGSQTLLERWQKEGKLVNFSWFLQANQGQASARNKGAEMASSSLLVFIDDDVIPDPTFLEGHLGAHAENNSVVVLGDARVVLEDRQSLYHLGFWVWWEDKYFRRSLPHRKPCSRDFCSGNFSIKNKDFLKVGGFDSSFRMYGGEDYELGYRLINAGISLVVDRRASARHCHRTSVDGVLNATRQEADGDVLMGQRHPELKAGLRLSRLPDDSFLWVVRLAVWAPFVGDVIFCFARRLLPWLEKAKMRMKWQKVFNVCRGYAYWRGVRDVLGGWQELMAYQKDLGNIPETSLDITEGLPVELDKIWVEGPNFIHLTYNGNNIGVVEIETPIEEPLPYRLAKEISGKLALPIALAYFSSCTDSKEDQPEKSGR